MPSTSLATSLIWSTIYSTHGSPCYLLKISGTLSPLKGLCISCSICLDPPSHLFWISLSQLSLLWPSYFKLQCTFTLPYFLLYSIALLTYFIIYLFFVFSYLLPLKYELHEGQNLCWVCLLVNPKSIEQCLAYSRHSRNISKINTCSIKSSRYTDKLD